MNFWIVTYRGDTPTIEFEITHADTNQPLNLSGWNVFFSAKKRDGTLLFTKQMTVVDPEKGKVQVRLSHLDTDYVGQCIAEIEARKGNDTLTIAQGVLIIREDVKK